MKLFEVVALFLAQVDKSFWRARRFVKCMFLKLLGADTWEGV